jgi:hypothetical protein
MAILSIFQHFGELAGRPEFVPIRILLSDSLKDSVMLIGDALGIHGDSGFQFLNGKRHPNHRERTFFYQSINRHNPATLRITSAPPE